MSQSLLCDERWSKLKPILLQSAIYHKCDLRITVEGILYRMCVDLPCENLSRAFGLRVTSAQRLVRHEQMAQDFSSSGLLLGTDIH